VAPKQPCPTANCDGGSAARWWGEQKRGENETTRRRIARGSCGEATLIEGGKEAMIQRGERENFRRDL